VNFGIGAVAAAPMGGGTGAGTGAAAVGGIGKPEGGVGGEAPGADQE
jgi:hypothetical protein